MINTEPEVELVPKYLVGREILSYPVLKKNVDIIPVVCPFERMGELHLESLLQLENAFNFIFI